MGDGRGSAPRGRPATFVFDGDCGFCSRYASWIAARLPSRVAVVAWQELESLAALGLTPEDVSCAAWWLDDDDRRAGAEAIARSLVAAGGLWDVLGRALSLRPVRPLARLAYRWVAEHRHLLPGGASACEIEGARGAGEEARRSLTRRPFEARRRRR